MNKTDIPKSMLKRIEKLKKDIAARRDKLRELIYEMEQLSGNCDVAIDNLECAADQLSELL